MSISGITNINSQAYVASPERSADAPAATERQSEPASGKHLPPGAEQAVSREEVSEAISDIMEYMPSISRELQFQLDEQTSSPVITVRDAETMEVVRQIPSKEVIAIAQHIAEFAPDPLSGILLDGRG